MAGPDCLSEESAAGYRPLITCARNLLIVVGATEISRDCLKQLRSHVQQGASLIWESAAFHNFRSRDFEEIFGVRTGQPFSENHEMYVRYLWPTAALIRGFGNVTPLLCHTEEAIAHYGNQPVASSWRLGKGRITFLGSMLGPHLRSGDREAHELAARLLRFKS